MIMDEVPPPSAVIDAPLQMLVTNLDYDEHKGRIALGRINTGCARRPIEPLTLNRDLAELSQPQLSRKPASMMYCTKGGRE
jgi:predicted membrane GTPase involved in stress response